MPIPASSSLPSAWSSRRHRQAAASVSRLHGPGRSHKQGRRRHPHIAVAIGRNALQRVGELIGQSRPRDQRHGQRGGSNSVDNPLQPSGSQRHHSSSAPGVSAPSGPPPRKPAESVQEIAMQFSRSPGGSGTPELDPPAALQRQIALDRPLVPLNPPAPRTDWPASAAPARSAPRRSVAIRSGPGRNSSVSPPIREAAPQDQIQRPERRQRKAEAPARSASPGTAAAAPPADRHDAGTQRWPRRLSDRCGQNVRREHRWIGAPEGIRRPLVPAPCRQWLGR